jgi:hypothetical protein
MTKLGRKPQYGDTCAAAGCTEPRHVLNSKGTPSRSRLCDRHYKADMAARYAARKEVVPTGYTVAEIFALWGTPGHDERLFYSGRQVMGIRICAAGYSLVLAGADAAQWVDADARLKVSK